MPASVLTAVIAMGACGLALLGTGMAAVIGGGSTLSAIGGVLGVAELVIVGRVIERGQTARVVAISLAILQALLGVVLLAAGHPFGLLLIPLAGLVVVPLSLESAETFFTGVRE